MKIIVYEPDYDHKHRKVLRAFAVGCGAEVRDVEDYVDCDLAVIFGMPKRAIPRTMSKLPIIEKHQGRRLIVIDSAPVRRGEYWAVGYGALGGRADFRTEGIVSLSRWRGLGVRTHPWHGGDKVIVVGQVPHDANVQDTDHIRWCQETFEYCSSLQPAEFRPHPRVAPEAYGIPEKYINTEPLVKCLKRASCVVTFNSTMGTDAALRGTPVIALDEGSFAYPVAGHSLADLVPVPTLTDPVGCALRTPRREPWLAKLAYSQWTLAELESGTAWAHLSRP